MDSRMLKIVLALLGAGAVFSGVFFIQAINKDKARNSLSEEGNIAIPVFQPDSQFLGSAINPELEASASTSAPVSFSPEPASTSYVYKKDVCVDNPVECFQLYYKNLVIDYGVDIAFSDIKARYAENPVVSTECHPLVHIIGQEASSRYATVSEAYLHGDSLCWSGYYHGILEGVIGRIGLEKLPAELDSICADIPGKETRNFNYYNCVHGLGHGIMESLADEVPASLVMCDNLSDAWDRESCYGGVFMENIIANNKHQSSKYLKPEDPLYPCNSIDFKYKYQCYLGQTSYALEVSNYDFKKVFEMCATVEDPFRNICHQSLGRDAANQARYNAEIMKNTCEISVNADDRNNCIIGAVKDVISYYHDNTQALDFCNILPGVEKEVCTNTANSYYQLF